MFKQNEKAISQIAEYIPRACRGMQLQEAKARLEKKSRSISMTAVMLPFLMRPLRQLLTAIRGSLFFVHRSAAARGGRQMSIIKGQLISSQRYLNMSIVNKRATRFKRFIVNVHPVVLRGVQYTILMDGHHNYAAAKLAGVDPDYRPVTKKVMKIIGGMSEREQEALFINNVTDSDYYYVETGEVVEELRLPDTSCKFQAHAGNQWIFGGAA